MMQTYPRWQLISINAIASFRNYSWERQWNWRVNSHPLKAHSIEIFQWRCAFRIYFTIVLERTPYLFLQNSAHFRIPEEVVRNRRKNCCWGVTPSNPMIPGLSDWGHNMDIQKAAAAAASEIVSWSWFSRIRVTKSGRFVAVFIRLKTVRPIFHIRQATHLCTSFIE